MPTTANNWIAPETRALTQTEMEHNAAIFTRLGRQKGWSDNAIAALLGNLEAESSINPARWQSDLVGDLEAGFGLAQWTPATKIRDWIVSYYGNTDYNNGDYQTERFAYEAEHGLQYFQNEGYTYNQPSTFSEWLTSTTYDAEYLAKSFLHNYERPADQSASVEDYRASLASKWYAFIQGSLPGGTIPIWLLFKCGRRKLK